MRSKCRSNLPNASVLHSPLMHLWPSPNAMASSSSHHSSPAVGNPLPSGSHKHGLSRFSLRRLFSNGPYFGRKGFVRTKSTVQNSAVVEPDTTQETVHGQSLNRKESSSFKETFRLTANRQCSSDSESNSLSSGRSDLHHGESNHSQHWTSLECPLCLLELPPECFPELSSCSHRACCDCLQQYLRIEILESRVNISCPECTEPIHPNDIKLILNDESMMGKYESFMLRRVLVTEPDARWCPAPDCGYVVIASGCASCPKLRCERPGCDTYFCYHCKQEWHPNQTCDAARAQRAYHSPNARSSSMSFSHDSVIQRDDIKHCPCCRVLIIKMDDGSCNHMTCSVCGTEFCWLCMKEISDLHYLSPSGCTFWGKKPWSRKKKILWQLGMLVGAPVGIALIAGIAVPAIIIGIPVWVGRKLHAKYDRHSSSRARKNFVVTGGVVASILVSPIIAGIAVGIGVPILLAYVYGVVPVSLCRSGGCGVTTSASGVRIEFDEENEIGIANGAAADGVSVDTAASHRANASIGEASLGMSTSLSLGSGTHLEQVGLLRDSDKESASNTAIAGHSLTGSIASASIGGNASHKLEVQADVSSNKRFSLSSHSETASATVSLSERSANMSAADDAASTRALAGSILGYREGTLSAIAPVEVHVDAQSTPDEALLIQKSPSIMSHGDGPEELSDVNNTYSDDSSSCGGSRSNSTRCKLLRPTARWQHCASNCSHINPESKGECRMLRSSPSDLARVSFIDETSSIPYNASSSDSSKTGEVALCGGYEVWLGTPGHAKPLLKKVDSNSPPVQTSLVKVPLANCDEEVDATIEVPVGDIPEICKTISENKLPEAGGYCSLCQITHRPCCPNAFINHRVLHSRAVCAPEGATASLQSFPLHRQTADAEVETCRELDCENSDGLLPQINIVDNSRYKPAEQMNDVILVSNPLPFVEEPETSEVSQVHSSNSSAPYVLVVKTEESTVYTTADSCTAQVQVE